MEVAELKISKWLCSMVRFSIIKNEYIDESVNTAGKTEENRL